MKTSYSPWSNFASITHKLIDQRDKINIHSEPEHFRLNSSLNMLIIIGFASSIEGFFRSFLMEIKHNNNTELKWFEKIYCFFKNIFFQKQANDLSKQTWNDLKGSYKKITK